MSGTALLFATLAAIVLLLFLILRFKLHAFLALIISSIALGIAAGMPPPSLLNALQKGMADLLGSIALIIGAGAIIGRMIEVSGGGEVMARTLIRAFGVEHTSWAFLSAAYLIGIPVFFDAAFFTMIPLVWNVSREAKRSLLLYAMPVLAALTATHGLIPTHPGPAAAAKLMGADPGRTVLYGLLLSVPMAIAGGVVYGRWIARRTFVTPPDNLAPASSATATRPAPFAVVLIVLLFPVILIGFAAVSQQRWIQFFGAPIIALFLTALLALFLLGSRSGLKLPALLGHISESLNALGSLILIIGASGAFKEVIVESGAGANFAQLMVHMRIPPILMAYVVGAALRIVLGSATAAIVTAASMVAPLASSMTPVDPALMVMAVATGGSLLSHVNDAGFWMVKEYCGMTVSQTLRSYSVMKAVTSITGLICLWIFGLFL